MSVIEEPPVQDEQPYYARRNNDGMYTWEGVQYPSVTTVLSSAPGQHLMLWTGKQASLKAASHLIQAGVQIPEGDEELENFCAGLVDRHLSIDDAHREILQWAVTMRESERYRDHKARIGSVTHHALYERAIGVTVDAGELEDYLRGLAISLDLWRAPASESMVCELAHSALAYTMSAFEWCDNFLPEWEAIGQEAVVIRKDHDGDGLGYAGTVDCTFTLRKSAYERNGLEWVWPEDQVSLTADFKTSNSLAKSVQAQIEAYANADFIGMVATGEEFAIPPSQGIGALHIGPHPSMAQVEDEYGVLATKAKIVGTKLHTWPRNPDTFEAFMGLRRWFNFTTDTPKSHQTKTRKAAEPKRDKNEPRPCPFG